MGTKKLSHNESIEIATRLAEAVIGMDSQKPTDLTQETAKKVTAFFAEVYAECRKIDIEFPDATEIKPPRRRAITSKGVSL
jgi:hypothetical protein